MSNYYRKIYETMGVEQYVNGLKDEMKDAAWIDANLMYFSTDTPEIQQFACVVLSLLQVEISEERIDESVAAHELIQHVPRCLRLAVNRRERACESKDIEQESFWSTVVDRIERYYG